MLVFTSGTPKAVDAAGLASVPDDWTLPPLGDLSLIHAQVTAALPQVDWADARRGQYEDADCALAFNLGTDDPVPP